MADKILLQIPQSEKELLKNCQDNFRKLGKVSQRVTKIEGDTYSTSRDPGKVQVSSTDPVADYLEDKLVAGEDITLTRSTDGSTEILTAATQGKSKVSSDDTTGGYLDGKLLAGTNITLTVGSPAGNETLTIAAGGGAHTALSDMPDTTGGNTNHDQRYVTQVSASAPTVPAPYAGMRWYDSDAVANPSMSFVVVTDTYIVADEVELVVCNKATAFTVTIPTASGSGRKITIKNIGVGSITVSKAGDTIDGVASWVLGTWDSMSISDDAANTWVIL